MQRLARASRHDSKSASLARLDRTKYAAGALCAVALHVLADAADGKPKVILLATGSEVPLCIDVYEKLKADGIAAQVVSMPSWEMFESYCQKTRYRRAFSPPR